MVVYYARPISHYNTDQDQRDLDTLQALGFEVVNPNTEVLQERYKKEGMDVFLNLIKSCDALAFRSFSDLKISAGVMKEINVAIDHGLLVIELPTLTWSRFLSVEETRNYLKDLGHK